MRSYPGDLLFFRSLITATQSFYPLTATLKLQQQFYKITSTNEKAGHKPTKLKLLQPSVHTLPPYCKTPTPKVDFQNFEIPRTNSVIYFKLHLDNKLNWRKHFQEKIKHIKITSKSMHWLTARNSKLSKSTKLLI